MEKESERKSIEIKSEQPVIVKTEKVEVLKVEKKVDLVLELKEAELRRKALDLLLKKKKAEENSQPMDGGGLIVYLVHFPYFQRWKVYD